MNETQTVETTPIGGTFTLTAYGKVSEPVPWNASPDDINAVLESLWAQSRASPAPTSLPASNSSRTNQSAP